MSKKILGGAVLEGMLLRLIYDAADTGLYGYSMLKLVDRKFGVHLGASTLYSELRGLEKHGLIISSWEFAVGKARRQYRITRKGERQLREYFAEIKTVFPAFASCKLG